MNAVTECLVSEADHVGVTADEKLTEQGRDIATYGSAKWQADFIQHSDYEQQYGSKNRMPVRWLTGDYYPTEVGDSPAVETDAGTTKKPEADKAVE